MQIDGSPFAWLEARGAPSTLFRQLFTRHGLPLAVYGDRLNLLVRNDPH